MNQWLNPLKRDASSKLMDMGWTAAHVDLTTGKTTPTSVSDADHEATVNACGVAVARLQRNSWSPILPTGTW